MAIRYTSFIVLALFSFTCAFADTFHGTVSLMTEDHLDGTSATQSPLLAIHNGQTYLIEGPTRNQLVAAVGHEVTVEGAVTSFGILHVTRILEQGPRVAFEALPSESGLRLLVGVFDIGASLADSITATQVKEILIDDPARSVKKLLEANSYGAVSISDVTVATRSNLGISAPPTGGSCYPWYSGTLLPAISSAFSSQGITSSDFDRVLLILPGTVGQACNFAGLAISSKETLYSGSINSTLVLHELGHNVWPGSGFGFSHASSDYNNDGVIDDAYGDNFDAMGISGYWYNFEHEEKTLWWTNAGGTTRTLSEAGSYTVSLPSAEFHPRNVTAPQRISVVVAGDSRPYYITFRKMVGTVSSSYYDAFVDDRLNIHRGGVSPSRNTLLLGEVIEGSSYSLSSPRILIEFLGQANNVASVRISIGPVDSDNDGVENLIDTDDDNDGVSDTDDCSPTISSRWTRRAYIDFDNDGVPVGNTTVEAHVCVGSASNTGYTLNAPPPRDNCSSTYNPDQLDSDGDGNGDACDSPTAGTPPGSSTPIPPDGSPPTTAFTIVSARILNGVFTAVFRSLGQSLPPVLSCTALVPGKSIFGTKNMAKAKRPRGLLREATCLVPLKKVGTYTVRFKACEGTSCSTSDISVRRKR